MSTRLSAHGLGGLVGWAAMPEGPAPPAERWGHLILSAVRGEVLAG